MAVLVMITGEAAEVLVQFRDQVLLQSLRLAVGQVEDGIMKMEDPEDLVEEQLLGVLLTQAEAELQTKVVTVVPVPTIMVAVAAELLETDQTVLLEVLEETEALVYHHQLQVHPQQEQVEEVVDLTQVQVEQVQEDLVAAEADQTQMDLLLVMGAQTPEAVAEAEKDLVVRLEPVDQELLSYVSRLDTIQELQLVLQTFQQVVMTLFLDIQEVGVILDNGTFCEIRFKQYSYSSHRCGQR